MEALGLLGKTAETWGGPEFGLPQLSLAFRRWFGQSKGGLKVCILQLKLFPSPFFYIEKLCSV